jgi:hypothetical protein
LLLLLCVRVEGLRYCIAAVWLHLGKRSWDAG